MWSEERIQFVGPGVAPKSPLSGFRIGHCGRNLDSRKKPEPAIRMSGRGAYDFGLRLFLDVGLGWRLNFGLCFS